MRFLVSDGFKLEEFIEVMKEKLPADLFVAVGDEHDLVTEASYRSRGCVENRRRGSERYLEEIERLGEWTRGLSIKDRTPHYEVARYLELILAWRERGVERSSYGLLEELVRRYFECHGWPGGRRPLDTNPPQGSSPSDRPSEPDVG